MDANKNTLDFTELLVLLGSAANILSEFSKQASFANLTSSADGAAGGVPGKADSPVAQGMEVIHQFVLLLDIAKAKVAKSLSPGKASPDAPENAEEPGLLYALLSPAASLDDSITGLASDLKQAMGDLLFKDGDKPADIATLLGKILQGKDFAGAIAANLNGADANPIIIDSSASGASNGAAAFDAFTAGSPGNQAASGKGLINSLLSVLSRLGNLFASQGGEQGSPAAGATVCSETAGPVVPGVSSVTATTGSPGVPDASGATGTPGLAASGIPQTIATVLTQLMAPLGHSGTDSSGAGLGTAGSELSGGGLTSAMFIPPMPQSMPQVAPPMNAHMQYGPITAQGGGISRAEAAALAHEGLMRDLGQMVIGRNTGVKQ